MKGMTPKQKEVRDFIAKFCKRKGFSPTIQEITEAMGFANTNCVAAHIAALKKKGFITVETGKARTLRIVEGKTSC